MNTRANKSLACGPGLLREVCPGAPVEFMIIARNDLGENRTSGRDKFEVKVLRCGDDDRKGEEYPCEVKDAQNGAYWCRYSVPDECEVEVHITFEDDKGKMVPVRGSPYSAQFSSKAKPADNLMTGGATARQIQKELERLAAQMQETKKDISTKDKDLKDVKVLLAVKSKVEETQAITDLMTLQID